MKINKHNLFSRKAGISYFEMLILITAGFAFAFFTKISFASAEVDGTSCCPELKNGANCQELLTSQCSSQCSQQCAPSRCSQISSCQLGCCYDKREGLCQANVPSQECSSVNVQWFDNANCNIDECSLGCCVLNTNSLLATEKRCEKLSAFYGLETDFRSEINNNFDCLSLANQQDEGACITDNEERSCKFTTKAECIRITRNAANFYKDYLCSNPELNTNCIRQTSRNCVEDKDEVYWIDSCNNRENIFSNDRNASWNQGRLLRKEQSCNANSSNIDSLSCGNCNYFLGSACSGSGSNSKCASLNCNNAPDVVDGFGKIISTKNRKNGESWCVYDGIIGNGRDVPGSRHYRYYCIDGQVKSEPCGDYRSEICVENSNIINGQRIESAGCLPNRAPECFNYNVQNKKDSGEIDREQLKKDCEENSACQIINLDFGKKYDFSVCTPKYPTGFDLSSQSNALLGKALCDYADFKCTKVMVKNIMGKWKCFSGCDCDSIKFTQQMNDWCASLGDCGGYVNIAGKTTDSGYKIKNAPKINLKQYEKNAVPVANQRAELGNISALLTNYYGSDISADDNIKKTIEKINIIPIKIPIVYQIYMAFGMMLGFVFGIDAGEPALDFAARNAAVMYLTPLWFLAGYIFVWSFIFAKIIGFGKSKKIIAQFNCEAWQAPRGGSDCEKCSQDLLKPCTKYQCASLGQLCELANEGTGKEICYKQDADDISPPAISPWNDIISSGFRYTDVSPAGFKIIGNNNDCIQEFQPVIFGISTNKPSQCKMDITHTQNYDEMEDYLGESNLYLYNHSMGFNIPSESALINDLREDLSPDEIANLRNILIRNFGNLTLYVRCIDKIGNYNLNEYAIKTCVNRKDITPPYVTKTIPENNAYTAYNASETFVKIYTNEPADCRYSNADNNYGNMNKSFACLNNLENVELYGWACTANVKINNGDNNFYIKCKDQPWLDDNNSSRNIMASSYLLTLKKSPSELKISNLQPNRTIYAGAEPASIILKADTSGGVNSIARCYFSFSGFSNMIQFLNTNAMHHEQELNQMIRGSYNIFVRCIDTAGNEARAITRFAINIDTEAPKIVRAYQSNGLKIITNEDSECAYSTKSCLFDWQNATIMAGLEREHTAEWKINQIYYIKCRDIWGNKPGECSIIAKAGRNPEINSI